jgi:hypothetical protein
MTYKFECWEIDFPSDDEDTRGVRRELAEELTEAGILRVVHEQVVTNRYGEKVFSHCYTPTSDANEALAWDAWDGDE